MKCHYEILSVARDTSSDDLKKSYRKLALKFHPDKNPGREEEVRQEFLQVQQAYEVLSDPQERAWYDKHREAILKGGLGKGGEFEDDVLDVYAYFTPTCFAGYGDDEKGFYAVYRGVFETIWSQDVDYLDDKDSLTEAPGFGDSASSYEEVVGPFYGYWESYMTRRSYVWKDKYDTREGESRWVRRRMEAENKKLRDAARKERNDEVRALVAFVRKRDKRVKVAQERLAAKHAEQEQRRKEKKERQNRQRAEELAAGQEERKAAMKEHEAMLRAQLGDMALSSSEDTDAEEEVVEEPYCVACNKYFRTEKSLQNHERSKKHREMVELLKAAMVEEEEEEEDESLGEEEEEDALEDFDVDSETAGSDVEQSNPGDSDSNSIEEPKEEKDSVDKDDTEKPEVPGAEEEGAEGGEDSADMLESLQRLRKQKRVPRTSVGDQGGEEEDEKKGSPSLKATQEGLSDMTAGLEELRLEASAAVNDPDDSAPQQGAKKRRRRAKGKDKKEESSETPDQANEVPRCNTCSTVFGTRNKLFSHLKTTGHSLTVEGPTKKAGPRDDSEERGGRRKGKKKR